MTNDTGSITCGKFSATRLGAGRYLFTCSVLSEFRVETEATQDEARSVVVDLQAEARRLGWLKELAR